MDTVKVSSKGQIVIPKDIRDKHHIVAGAELEIYTAGEEIHLRLAPRLLERTSVAAGRGMLAATGRKRRSDEELKRQISARLKARDAVTKARR